MSTDDPHDAFHDARRRFARLGLQLMRTDMRDGAVQYITAPLPDERGDMVMYQSIADAMCSLEAIEAEVAEDRAATMALQGLLQRCARR